MTFNAQYENIGETRASGLELAGTRARRSAGFASAAATPCSIRKSFAASAAARSSRRAVSSTAGRVIPARCSRRTRAIALCLALGGVFIGSRVDSDFNFSYHLVQRGLRHMECERRGAFRTPHAGYSHDATTWPIRDYMEPLGYPASRPHCARRHTNEVLVVSRPPAAISWSGGKDSCAAYHRARDTFDIVAAITMFNEDGTRSRSHGLRPEIIAAQVRSSRALQSISQRCTWDTTARCSIARLPRPRRSASRTSSSATFFSTIIANGPSA